MCGKRVLKTCSEHTDNIPMCVFPWKKGWVGKSFIKATM